YAARYPPYHQLSTVNSNSSPRVRTLKRNTLVGPQLHQGGANRFQVSAARALWLLLPIVIGAGAATQTLAHLLNYHPSLGPNLFHFYPPLVLFRVVLFVAAHQSFHFCPGLWRGRNGSDRLLSIFRSRAEPLFPCQPVPPRFGSLGRRTRYQSRRPAQQRWRLRRRLARKAGDDPLPPPQRTRTYLVLRAHA